jgi:hypothetical protein
LLLACIACGDTASTSIVEIRTEGAFELLQYRDGDAEWLDVELSDGIGRISVTDDYRVIGVCIAARITSMQFARTISDEGPIEIDCVPPRAFPHDQLLSVTVPVEQYGTLTAVPEDGSGLGNSAFGGGFETGEHHVDGAVALGVLPDVYSVVGVSTFDGGDPLVLIRRGIAVRTDGALATIDFGLEGSRLIPKALQIGELLPSEQVSTASAWLVSRSEVPLALAQGSTALAVPDHLLAPGDQQRFKVVAARHSGNGAFRASSTRFASGPTGFHTLALLPPLSVALTNDQRLTFAQWNELPDDFSRVALRVANLGPRATNMMVLEASRDWIEVHGRRNLTFDIPPAFDPDWAIEFGAAWERSFTLTRDPGEDSPIRYGASIDEVQR